MNYSMLSTSAWSRARYRLKSALGWASAHLEDARRNRRCAAQDQRILVTRHCAKHSTMFRDFFTWVCEQVPELMSRLEFRRLPFQLPARHRYAAHVCWINDTLDLWSPNGFRQECELVAQCRAAGVGVVNAIGGIHNVGKLRGSELMRASGARTPQCRWAPPHWRDAAAPRVLETLGLQYPVLIREERGHGCPSLLLNDERALNQADLTGFATPIVAEFVDTRDARGRFRKYRYVTAGHLGVPRHLITDMQWDARPHRRVRDEQAMAEEESFVSHPTREHEHETFRRARVALGMEVVGFDYSYTRDGTIVIWEANPFLDMNRPKYVAAGHLDAAVERTYAAVAHCYLATAGVEIPNRLFDLLGDVATWDRDGSAVAGAA
ncbi:MAG: hypothetical protein KDB14_06930 [Planctomycetales bacterium]|nr:hypothetical protein [Planctomycetales bacterium]